MSTQGLKGLKHVADATLLADLKVTPELKARLAERIERAETHGEVVPERSHRPWLRSAGYTIVAAAAAVVIMLAGRAPLEEQLTVGRARPMQPVPLPESYQQSSGSTATNVLRGKLTVTALDVQGNTAYLSTVPATLNDSSGPTIPQAITRQAAAEAQPGRKIITNGEYGLRVTNARGAVDRLQRDAIAAGGYVAEATVNKEASGAWVGRIVLRVPASRAAETVQSLSQIGTVERERQWTQDVSDQWMDLEHRIVILKEHEQRLRELSERAATFEDWNKLATQLNSTRVEVENLTGRLKLLANQVEFAILNIQVLQPAPGEVPVSTGATSFGGQLGEAFSNSIRYMTALGRQGALGLAAIAPYALGLVPLALVVLLVRRGRRAGRA